MVVGMVGIEGNVVGMVGSEVAGSGGRVTLGPAGMVGNVGIGKDDGIWVLGKGGNVVGFGKVGAVGNVGKAVLGNGGSVACGMVGTVGNGGNATLGRAGIVGTVCSSWRAAQVIWVLESANAKIRDRTKQCWKAAIVLYKGARSWATLNMLGFCFGSVSQMKDQHTEWVFIEKDY